MMQQEFSDGIYYSTQRMLHAAFMPQRIPRGPYIDGGDEQECNHSDYDGSCKAGMHIPKDDVANVILEMHNQHQGRMYNNEAHEGKQAEEMQAARTLFAAKDLKIPREACFN